MNEYRKFYFCYIVLICALGCMFLLKDTKEITKDEEVFQLNKSVFSYANQEDIQQYLTTNLHVVEYPKIDFTKLGKQEITFLIEKEHMLQVYRAMITIVDDVKPEVITNNIMVEENKQFILKEMVTIKDKSSFTVNPDVLMLNDSKIVEIEVKDEYNNTTNTNIFVEVIKTKKQIKQPLKSTVFPKSKQFLFADGYDFNTAKLACEEALSHVLAGACLPLQVDDIYVGYKFLPE